MRAELGRQAQARHLSDGARVVLDALPVLPAAVVAHDAHGDNAGLPAQRGIERERDGAGRVAAQRKAKRVARGDGRRLVVFIARAVVVALVVGAERGHDGIGTEALEAHADRRDVRGADREHALLVGLDDQDALGDGEVGGIWAGAKRPLGLAERLSKHVREAAHGDSVARLGLELERQRMAHASPPVASLDACGERRWGRERDGRARLLERDGVREAQFDAHFGVERAVGADLAVVAGLLERVEGEVAVRAEADDRRVGGPKGAAGGGHARQDAHHVGGASFQAARRLDGDGAVAARRDAGAHGLAVGGDPDLTARAVAAHGLIIAQADGTGRLGVRFAARRDGGDEARSRRLERPRVRLVERLAVQVFQSGGENRRKARGAGERLGGREDERLRAFPPQRPAHGLPVQRDAERLRVGCGRVAQRHHWPTERNGDGLPHVARDGIAEGRRTEHAQRTVKCGHKRLAGGDYVERQVGDAEWTTVLVAAGGECESCEQDGGEDREHTAHRVDGWGGESRVRCVPVSA